jgi:hypothetical protein
MQRYQAIGEIEPEMRKKLEGEVARTGRLYKWRNRLLFVGFLILVAARFTAFSWW